MAGREASRRGAPRRRRGLAHPGSFEGGTFKLRNANSAGAADATFFGDPRGFPVAGDWNGDGIDDVAVYRNGMWQFRYVDGPRPYPALGWTR